MMTAAAHLWAIGYDDMVRANLMQSTLAGALLDETQPGRR
jgi:hypothetical protein